MKPAALIFDLAGTVLAETRWDLETGSAALYDALAGAALPPRAEFVASCVESLNDLKYRRISSCLEVSIQARMRLALARFAVEPRQPYDELERLFYRTSATYEAEPGIADALADAGRRGLALAVLSNNGWSGYLLEEELHRFGLRRPFRFVISTADWGVRKPDPIIFRAAASRLRLDPGTCWYLGDTHAMDVVGGKAAGMTAVWYNPTSKPPADPEPDHTLTHWSGLAGLLDAA